ncbi:MAG TPA: invasion associated locus B family protein [Hyphomicrobiaceae bacterium]|nr:invasion associated locus B family protein [Hyphomicrobiaceae bacterium]
MMRGASVLEGAARRVLAVCGVGAALALGATMAAAPVVAQQKQAAPPAKTAPAAKDAKAGEPQSAWVKLCEKAPFIGKDKAGKEQKEEKNVCLTHHERIDGNTGMVMVSAAIRQIEGADKQHLMIMVPLGMAIHPGLRATVYPKDLWAQVEKNQKVEDPKLEPIKLNYALCHPAGCTAEVEATKDVVDKMKTGGGVMVLAINAQGQVIAFPVPLIGFAQAYDGPPVDNQKYSEARKALMTQIAQRQQQLFEEYKKKQAAAAEGGQAATQGQQAPSAAPKKK